MAETASPWEKAGYIDAGVLELVEALAQVQAGADILDLNVGVARVDETMEA